VRPYRAAGAAAGAHRYYCAHRASSPRSHRRGRGCVAALATPEPSLIPRPSPLRRRTACTTCAAAR
jgi:hypothetical protein